MKILVTGGAGFIGSHIADALLDRGHKVVIVDNLSTGARENINPDAKFFAMDIRDDGIAELFREQSFDLVCHQAAQIDVRKSVADPVADVETNIAGSVALMEQARCSGVQRFLFASTGGAIYGEQDHFPADESHPERPLSPYGVAKLAVEKYMYFYHSQYGMHMTALRYANVYGPRQNPFGEAGVVAIFSRRMLDGEQAFINGDGLQTRDYVYVSDVVRANLAALQLERFHTVNIGTGIETDVVTIFDHLNRATGAGQPCSHRPGAPGEQRRSCIDPGLAEKLLGWKPQVGLEEGLRTTVEYFREHRR